MIGQENGRMRRKNMSNAFKWHKRFLKLAHEVASWSKDRYTHVGAVIIGPDRDPRSFGYNGFPRNIDDEISERHERPLKYKWSEHAEKNALANCNRVGIPTKGCSIYITHFPCTECARMIIQSGLEEVIVDNASMKQTEQNFRERWDEDLQVSKTMLEEAHVKIEFIDL